MDPRFKNYLNDIRFVNDNVDLEAATVTGRGHYWYILYVVLVVADCRRWPVTRHENFERLRDGCLRIATKRGAAISAVSIMPDHIHLPLRGNIEHSPQEIALSYLNNLSYLMGFNECWSREYYVWHVQ